MIAPHVSISMGTAQELPAASAYGLRSTEDLERLGEEIAELAAHLHAATYRLIVRLREFDEREGWSNGFLSCAHWLSWRTGIALGAAREKVRVARAFAKLPRLAAAMERGELSFSKARALTRIATPENEEELLALARHATAAQVEKVVRAWRRVDRLAEAEAERARHEARHFTVLVDDDGSYVVRGRLDPEVGALLERALDAAAKALDDDGSRSTTIGAGVAETVEVIEPGDMALAAARPTAAEQPTALERPTAAQRRADALGLVVELALSRAPSRAAGALEEPIGPKPPPVEEPVRATAVGPVDDRAHPSVERRTEPVRAAVVPSSRGGASSVRRAGRVEVVLHVDAEALRAESESGQAVLAGGVRVSAETSRRLACDAGRVVMTHDRAGRALDVGRRTRTVPAAIRRALEHRDRGCRFPGCGNRFTDAHHVRHWADGGATRLENLILLCRRHHRAVHEEGYRVTATEDGAFMFSRPDGQLIPQVPPMPTCSRAAATNMEERRPPIDGTGQAGIGASGASWERFDLDWTLLTLYTPRANTAIPGPGIRTAT